MQKLRIQLVLPFEGLTGGNLILLELANRLQQRGHQVWMIYDYPDIPWWKPRGFAKMKLRDWGAMSWVNWFQLHVPVLRCPKLSAQQVPDADLIIVSHWLHADQVAALPDCKGKKIYYVQAYETDFITGGLPLEEYHPAVCRSERMYDAHACEATYRLPLKHVVVAGWLGRLMWQRFGQPSVKATAPIDYTQYPVLQSRSWRPVPRCLIQYHDLLVKGTVDGIGAFELARREVPGMELTLFGPRTAGIRSPHRILPQVSPAAMPDLYRQHDILIWPSHVEGFGLPAIEALACQCALASTDNGGSEEFAFHEKTALVSPARNPKALAANLVRLARDIELRQRLAREGCDWVRHHITWERTCDTFERCGCDDALWTAPKADTVPVKGNPENGE